MTCNPKWKDIENNLFQEQEVLYSPDLIARVFNMKLKVFLNDVIKSKAFGCINA